MPLTPTRPRCVHAPRSPLLHTRATQVGDAGKAKGTKALAKKTLQLKDAQAAFDTASCQGFKKKGANHTAEEKDACALLKVDMDESQTALNECTAGNCKAASATGAVTRDKPSHLCCAARMHACMHACMHRTCQV